MKLDQIDKEVAAISRISLGTWLVIVTLISTLCSWGITTYANSAKNSEQDIAIKEKQDEKDADKQFNILLKRIEELHEDIREVRQYQIDQAKRDKE